MLTFEDLTKFNHALVYGFEPESTLASSVSGENLDNGVEEKFGQFEDMLNAYVWMQNDVLPKLIDGGVKDLTPEGLVQLIKDMHSRIALSVLKESKYPPWYIY